MLFKMAEDREEDAIGKVLRGEISDLPTIEGNVVRIFLSSTFTGISRSNCRTFFLFFPCLSQFLHVKF